MTTISFNNKFRWILSYIQCYNHQKYWKRRAVVVTPNNHVNILTKLYNLYYIKKVDARHHCSFGTNLNNGTMFLSPPHLPHGPNGIIIGHDLKIGKNCTIYQQVTLAHGGRLEIM